LQLSKLETILEDEGIVFLSYGGLLTQSIIVGMTEALEHESTSKDISMKVSHNILTIFIELSQNMMTYSNKMTALDSHFDHKGLIIVGYDDENEQYYILSRNVLKNEDKERISPRLEQVIPLNKEELKKLYRERRKSGKDKHEKGAGIGFIEIARRCDAMEYNFVKKDSGSHYFAFKAIINHEKGKING